MKKGTTKQFCGRDERIGPKHEMVGDNISIDNSGIRRCRACQKEARDANRSKKAAGLEPAVRSFPPYVYSVGSDLFIKFGLKMLETGQDPAAMLSEFLNEHTRDDK